MPNYTEHSLIATQPDWRYSDFAYKALQMAQAFKQQKVKSIAVWLEDGANLACTLLAAWEADVRVLFPPNLTQESREWVAQHAQFWLCDNDAELSPYMAFKDFGGDQQVQKQENFAPHFDRNAQTEIWLKTSGSTGEAKTIVKTAQQMWRSAQVLAEALPFPADNQWRAISTVSIQHVYGLTVHIMMSLALGWQIGRKQLFYPECIKSALNQSENAVLVSSPAMLSSIAWDTMAMPKSLRGIVSSGGALAEDVSTQIRAATHAPVVEIYGSTETGPIAIRDDIHLWKRLPNSQLGQDEQDALWIEADWISGREQTADVVEFEESGFRLLGRCDRIVKIGDKRTSLVSIERQLLQHPFVEDCYIARHPEQNRLAAWVGLTEAGINAFREQGRRALIAELKQAVAANQDKSAIPRFWRFTDKLPRNSQSKINKLAFNQVCLESVLDPIWSRPERDGNQYVIKGKVPLELRFLKDHFAEFPLVPGVIELQWISEKMQDFLGRDLNFSSIDRLKFQHFLRPNDEFELTLSWQPEKRRIAFQLKVAEETCCSGVALLME
ncbi:AMP-binding protein [Avibacterium gallinarum]|uniref:Acetyl-coenzyme A synthase n=1 Tax=Avibacterium gallinarum TaxID=755 RepID=A0A379AZP3_AVIGA|nr:AMP-binding protein [Avibacterium gallinarum]POY44215.1 AMP-binding protein [Avibacterium gallinarum]TDP29256.1 acyl-CoA synthetase (AMP-forming)/AMP-acid ligase II [Avibacterium gallinarum]SUB28216.1 acetyl-coenzyme A synthase [Avibacterium gallinarum]